MEETSEDHAFSNIYIPAYNIYLKSSFVGSESGRLGSL